MKQQTQSGKNRIWQQRRRRLFEIIEVGASQDPVSRGYDLLGALVILINLGATLAYTFDYMEL